MEVPCLIVDYVNIFSTYKKLNNVAEISAIYKDPPKRIVLKPEGIWLDMDVKSWEK